MVNTRLLHVLLTQIFNINDLQQLCFEFEEEIDIEYENLPGNTKDDKVRELILACRRRNKLEKLIEICRTKRPDADWIKIYPIPQNLPRPPINVRPMRTIATVVGALQLILVEQPDDWLLAVENQSTGDIKRIGITLVPPADVLVSETNITISSLGARKCSPGYALGLDAVMFRIPARVSYYAPGLQRFSMILEVGNI